MTEKNTAETELLYLAQSGDNRAFALLVARYEPMLRAQVAHFHLSRADAEDLSQEGLLGLLAAVRTFQPDKGAAFGTYAAVCVRNRLISVLRRRAAGEREVPVEDVESAGVLLAESFRRGTVDPATLLMEREAAEELLGRVRKHLSSREFSVLLRYLNGMTYEKIATELRISPKAVDNALQRVRHKLQDWTKQP